MAAAAEFDFGTSETDALCRDIAVRSKGVAILAFSHGKDSVAAWLYLRRYFQRIIPFHYCGVPNLSFANEALAYYERVFRTPIRRLIEAEVLGGLHDLIFQPIEDEDAIDALGIWDYNTRNVVELIREEHKVPDAWGATGIIASDSLTRRVIVMQRQGRTDSTRMFEPLYNWSRGQVLDIIESEGLYLAGDYLMGNRTFSGLPSLRSLERMETLFPADFEKVETMFPFIRAAMARNEFRRLHGPAAATATVTAEAETEAGTDAEALTDS